MPKRHQVIGFQGRRSGHDEEQCPGIRSSIGSRHDVCRGSAPVSQNGRLSETRIVVQITANDLRSPELIAFRCRAEFIFSNYEASK